MDTERRISVSVNGTERTATVQVRRSLSEWLRDDLSLTGTHVGCEQGVCGSCTVLVDGRAVRSCLMFAVQADGSSVTTVEGLAGDGELHPIQEAFWAEHGLQCGFCTPGLLLTALEFLQENHGPTEDEIRQAIAGNLCRCTGYQGVVRSIATADRTWER
jgi:aerobic-type carbon monoxide dehydrogenase small subunit (CoxS/CutS family)